MIDRRARDRAAEVLRHLVAGQTTNFDFEERFPDSKDPIVPAVEDSMWCFYDDFQKHKMKGKWEFPKETQKIMSRWILFLYTDEEYLWPYIRFPGVRPLRYGWLSRLLGQQKKEQEFMCLGNYSVWPFFDDASYSNALQNPKLLSGS